MIRFLATLAAACLLMAAPATAQQRPAGYVTGLDLPDGAPPPVLRRQGEALDVQVWRELFDGDALEVAGKATVTIETARDRRLVVDAARSPHKIEGELGGGGKFATFAATLGELFKSRPDKTAANLIGRNDAAPRLRMGRTRDRQIVVVGQPIWLTWQGGAAPFTVELTGQSRMRKLDIRALASVTTPTNEAKLVVPAEAAGNLTLVVRDADGREARAPLHHAGGRALDAGLDRQGRADARDGAPRQGGLPAVAAAPMCGISTRPVRRRNSAPIRRATCSTSSGAAIGPDERAPPRPCDRRRGGDIRRRGRGAHARARLRRLGLSAIWTGSPAQRAEE
jgi:hypothetical protein